MAKILLIDPAALPGLSTTLGDSLVLFNREGGPGGKWVGSCNGSDNIRSSVAVEKALAFPSVLKVVDPDDVDLDVIEEPPMKEEELIAELPPVMATISLRDGITLESITLNSTFVVFGQDRRGRDPDGGIVFRDPYVVKKAEDFPDVFIVVHVAPPVAPPVGDPPVLAHVAPPVAPPVGAGTEEEIGVATYEQLDVSKCSLIEHAMLIFSKMGTEDQAKFKTAMLLHEDGDVIKDAPKEKPKAPKEKPKAPKEKPKILKRSKAPKKPRAESTIDGLPGLDE